MKKQALSKFKKPVRDTNASKFWMGDWAEIMSETKGKDLLQLSGYRRAVSNFVRIVTGDNIPVHFSNNDQSHTDGKTVTISASTKPNDFDVTVGLALHEGSHIKLTDMSLLKDLSRAVSLLYLQDYASKANSTDSITDYLPAWLVKDIQLTYVNGTGNDEILLSNDLVLAYFESSKFRYIVYNKFKDIFNIVEDRRIDNFIYTTAPGYKVYYQALYDKYFNIPIIDRGLQSSEYRKEDWESYLFRLCNITNANRDLDALKGLRKIWEILDLGNVARMKTSQDAMQVAFDIFNVIQENIYVEQLGKSEEEQESEQGEGEGRGKGQSQSGNNQDAGTGNGEPEDMEVPDDGTKADGSDIVGASGQGTDGGLDLDELSDRQRAQLEKAIKDQQSMMEGQTKKGKLSKKEASAVNSLDEAGVDSKEVEYEGHSWHGRSEKKKQNVIVVRNFSRRVAEAVECGMWSTSNYNVKQNNKHITEGIRYGIMLGKKLKIRQEERSLKFNRLNAGKIDKRMIASAGYGMENIFEKIESFSFKPSIIHLSIDSSGSMGGSKFAKSLTTAAAIAKACSMIEHMDCVISFRSGSYINNSSMPIIVVAYDSRKHSISQLTSNLEPMHASGGTPEGLCFDAIMTEVLNSSRGKDAYFVNFSDGEPCYESYSGQDAWLHTKQQVNKMKFNGIKVISYFISEYFSESSRRAFNTMYGKDASFIDVSQINSVAKSMNDKFLEIA